jgi:predicted GNAT superfamily acetyltransferase
MLGVLPEFQNAGLGFALKYAQWELVRQAGIERITWTYDPLQSRNAHLNLARLGAVCRTYLPEYYGEMPDALNRGLPSDRFQVDVWVNSPRVLGKMSASPPRQPSLDDYFSAGVELLNPVKQAAGGFPRPPEGMWQPPQGVSLPQVPAPPGYLLEIPADFPALKAADAELALHWRMHTRRLFTDLFARGWHAADFVYVRGDAPRCFYLLRPAREAS